MSRIATLGIAFESRLAEAREAYDEFARYVEGRTLKIPVEWQPPSSGAPGSPTAPGTPSAPSPLSQTFGGIQVPFPVSPFAGPVIPAATPTAAAAGPIQQATAPVVTRTLTDAFTAALVDATRRRREPIDELGPVARAARFDELSPLLRAAREDAVAARRPLAVPVTLPPVPELAPPPTQTVLAPPRPPRRPPGVSVAELPQEEPEPRARRVLSRVVEAEPLALPAGARQPPGAPPPTQPQPQPAPIQVVARPVFPPPPPPLVPPGAFGGTAGTNLLGGLREGRLRQYATTGFLLIEAARLGQAAQNREEAIALSGGDLRQQVRAEQEFQQSVSGVPFVGQGAGIGAGGIATAFGFGPLGTSLTLQAADLQTRRQQFGTEDAQTRLNLRRQTAFIATRQTAGEFEARRLEAQQQREITIQEAEQRRQHEGDVDAQVINNQREKARSRFYENPLLFASSLLTPGTVSGAANLYANQAVAGEQTRRAAQRDQQLKQTTESAQALERVRLEDVYRDEINRRFNTVAGGVTARLRGENNPVGASFNQLLTENSNAAFNAPANLRPQVLEANTQRVREFFNTLRRETNNITDDVTSTTREIEAAQSGNRFGADLERINRETNQALRQIPRTGVHFLGFDLDESLGFNAQRRAVEAQAGAERRGAQQAEQARQTVTQGTIESLGLQLRHEPLAAAVAEIRANTQAQLTGVPLFEPSPFGFPTRLNPAFTEPLQVGLLQQENAQQRHDEQVRLLDIGITGERESLEARLARNPIGARAIEIETGGLERAEQLRQGGFRDQAQASLKNSVLSEQLLRQNYLDAFRGEQVDLRSINVQNPRDVEDPAAVLSAIQDQTDRLERAINDLKSD